MKTFSGKWVIILFLAACVGMAFVLYKTFKEAGNLKTLVMSELHKEFLDYSVANNQGSFQFTVADMNGEKYMVDFSKEWSFELRDKLLVLKSPALEPAPAPEVKPQVVTAAQETLNQLVRTWITHKFKSESDKMPSSVEIPQ